MNPEIMELIQTNLPGLRLRAQEPMSLHTSFRIGGPAAVFAQPDSVEALSALLALLQGEGLTPRILGAGTNVLAPDEGIDGVVISTRITGSRMMQTAFCMASLKARDPAILKAISEESTS